MLKNPSLKTKLSKLILEQEKRKSKEIISFLKKELPKEICGFKLKKVELFDFDFGDYIAEYRCPGSKIKMSLFTTILSDGGFNLSHFLGIYDLDGADYSKQVNQLSKINNVAKELIKAYKEKP